jgi:ankyrin repeat protein
MDPRSCLNEYEIWKKPRVLSKACSDGDLKQVKLFILKGLDVNSTDCNGNTPLFDAIRNEHSEIVRLLVQKGALINTRNNYGTTPLSLASGLGNMFIVQFLVKDGALIDSKDPNDRNPLTVACMNGHIHIAEYLIGNGASLNSKNKDGYTPLLQACLNGRHSIIELLLKSGADVNICDDFEGKTPLITLCSVENSENMIDVIEMVIKNGANVNQTDNQGLSALASACMNGNFNTVQLLIKNNADLNIQNKFSSTPLSLACFNGQTDIVRVLLENGADVNLQDQEGHTALFEACLHGSKDIVEILLAHGANLNHKNIHGSTAFQIAKEKENFEVLEFLKNVMIRDFYNLFKRTSSIRLKEMINDSLNNQIIFFIQRDHIEIFKEVDLDQFPEYIDFFKSFEFKEKLVEDVLNYLKDQLQLLYVLKLKLPNSNDIGKNKSRKETKQKYLNSFEQIQKLCIGENFFIFTSGETNDLIDNIQIYIGLLEENIQITNDFYDVLVKIK